MQHHQPPQQQQQRPPFLFAHLAPAACVLSSHLEYWLPGDPPQCDPAAVAVLPAVAAAAAVALGHFLQLGRLRLRLILKFLKQYKKLKKGNVWVIPVVSNLFTAAG